MSDPKSPPQPIRIGVIGCGHWGPNHIRVFSSLPGGCVPAMADVDPVRLERIGAQYPAVARHTGYADLLARPDIDAVVVCVPTRRHHEVVRAALLAGKHVLCEKPLAVDVTEAAELVELARERGRVLMVGHIFLFNSGIRRLKEYLAGGDLGRVRILRATRTNLGPVRADVNAVHDLATHDIAIFNHLLDAAPLEVSAVGACFLQPGVEDVAFVTLRYPGDVLAHIQVSWLDPKKIREIVAVGDRRMIVWDELAPAGPLALYDKGVDRPADYADFGQFQMMMREGDITIPKVRAEEPLKAQNAAFLRAVAAGLAPPGEGDFVLGVMRTLDAVTRSLRNRGAPVEVG